MRQAGSLTREYHAFDEPKGLLTNAMYSSVTLDTGRVSLLATRDYDIDINISQATQVYWDFPLMTGSPLSPLSVQKDQTRMGTICFLAIRR